MDRKIIIFSRLEIYTHDHNIQYNLDDDSLLNLFLCKIYILNYFDKFTKKKVSKLSLITISAILTNTIYK